MSIIANGLYLGVLWVALLALAKPTRQRLAKYFPAVQSEALLDDAWWSDATKYLAVTAAAFGYLISHLVK
jgi:hypothetical protein